MRPIDPAELMDLVEYERVRQEFRARVIELKRPRRIAVGERLTFIFENRDTVLFQIQEMLRAERVVGDEQIREQVEVYNELIPGADELSATLMIEILEAPRIRSELDRLVGIDEHVELVVDGSVVRALFDPKQREEDRISAVQYVRFPLGPSGALRFRETAVPVELRVGHPNYLAAAPIAGASRASLVADLEPDLTPPP